MTVFTDNFTESSLNSAHWTLNQANSFWFNPGWWSSNGNTAVYDPANDKIILRPASGDNALGSATLFGFDLSQGFTLEFDIEGCREMIEIIISGNGTSDDQTSIEWVNDTGNIHIRQGVAGNGSQIGDGINAGQTPMGGRIYIKTTEDTLICKFNGTEFYNGPMIGELQDGIVFIAGSGAPPSVATAIKNVSLTYGSDTPSAPIANFNMGNPLNVNQSIQFTDESTGTPTSWHWDFGDDSTSTEENPTHTYITPGTYTVILTATNSIGSDTKTKSIVIVQEIDLTEVQVYLDSSSSEKTIYCVYNGYIYWSGLWGNGNTGHIYKTNLATLETTSIYSASHLAMWTGRIINGKLYCMGQQHDSSSHFRIVMNIVDLSNDSVQTILVPGTDDTNEVISFDTDGTYIIAAERGYTAGTGNNSTWPNGAGVWKIPLATVTNVNTWVRVWEDPDNYNPTSICYYEGYWYRCAYNITGQFNSGIGSYGQWKLSRSQYGSEWTTVLDYTDNNIQMCFVASLIKTDDNLYCVGMDENQKGCLFILDNNQWVKKDLGITIPSNNGYFLNFAGYYDSSINKLVLFLSEFNMTGYSNFWHNTYIVDTDGNIQSQSLNNNGAIQLQYIADYTVNHVTNDGKVLLPLGWIGNASSKIITLDISSVTPSTNGFEISVTAEHSYNLPDEPTNDEKINKARWSGAGAHIVTILKFSLNGGQVFSATEKPTTDTHSIGDICFNENPTAGGYIGWICVSSGSPGTWKGFGLIES